MIYFLYPAIRPEAPATAGQYLLNLRLAHFNVRQFSMQRRESRIILPLVTAYDDSNWHQKKREYGDNVILAVWTLGTDDAGLPIQVNRLRCRVR